MVGLAMAGVLIAAGSIRAFAARRELAYLRRVADSELRLRATHHVHADLVAWRADHLTSPRHRAVLARSVEQTVRDLSPSRLPGATPLNRAAVRPHADLLLLIAERLRDQDHEVTPRGVLLVQDLLTSPDSPLYAVGPTFQVRPSLAACLRALDGVPPDLRHPNQRLTATGS